MRATPEAGLPAWPLRIFRPWLVATAGGLAIGASLLRFDSASFPNSYPESASHAAMYDPPETSSVGPAAPALPADPAPAVDSAGLFAPAEPIAAVAELGSAPGAVPAP